MVLEATTPDHEMLKELIISGAVAVEEGVLGATILDFKRSNPKSNDCNPF